MLEIPKILNHFMIFKWSDFIEILIFSSFIFYFSNWLQKDKQKKLLPTFYSLCFLFIASDYFGLFTLSNFLFSFAPVGIMLFILLHQNSIQKNFIAAKNITPLSLSKLDWVECLIKAMLTSTNSNKEIYCLIECQEPVANFVSPQISINTKIEKNNLEFLIESKQFNNKKFIWINHEGSIKSINTEWNLPDNFFIAEEKKLTEWQENSIKISSKTDAICIKSSSNTRTFEVIAQGKIMENILTDKAINLIEQFVKKNYLRSSNEFKTSSTYKQSNY